MKKFLLLNFLIALCFMGNDAFAQERTVSGTVTSAETGEALPGVNILLKGTTTGVVSDLDGNYRLSVPSDGGTLVFSFIGLQTKEVQIGNKSVVDVQLNSDAQQLNEVVVVGYGAVEARKLTSSISSVDAEKLAAMPVPSFDAALQGKAPGVQVSTTSGMLGEAPKIRIRGINSITSGTDPLIVVDGVPLMTGNFSGVAENNGLADINPNDIESFEVLKDGAATAIYGSRAANGVILITTKRGQAGTATINYDFYTGFNETANRFELLNAEEFVQISNEKFAAAGTLPQAFPGPGNVDTDWQDVIFRKGFVQSHNIGISGGNEAAKFYVSANYMDQDGAIVNNSIERYSIRGNIDYTGVKWLDAGLKVQASQQRNSGLNTGTNSLSGNISNATSAFPNIAVMNPDHPTGYNITPDNNAMGQGNNLQVVAFNLPNIKYVLDHNKEEAVNQRLLSNAYAQVNLPYDLKLRTQIGFDIADTRDFRSWNPVHGDGRPNGYVFRGYYNTTRWNWQNTLSYNRTVADVHTFNFVVGNEFQNTSYDQFTGSGDEFSDEFFIQRGLITGSYNNQYSSGFVGESGFESIFGRLNYDYDNKYLLSISLRRDALSSLPEATREGTFLGASAGWNIAQEDFFNVEAINDFKIRGSYAETGNTDIGLFPYLGTYGPELYGESVAIRFEQVGNSDLKWETSKKLSAGIDFSILSNRISGSIDWYRNDVDDLILQAPTPPSLGIPSNRIFKNIGTLKNEGFEFNINAAVVDRGDFSWSSNLNLTTNQNEIISLANNDSDVNYTYNILRVGEEIGAFYGFIYNGVNPANGNPIYTTADGSLIQGNPANTTYYAYDPANPEDISEQVSDLNEGDKVVLGSPNPDIYGGFSNSFSFKGIELGVTLTYAFGHQVLNVTQQELMTMEFSNNTAKIKDRWTPANTNTDVPRLYSKVDNFLNNDGNATTRFLEDADFVRVQNITLAYNLPQAIYSNIGLNKVRVYAQVQNAFVFTGYSGLDPELSYSNTTNIQAGIDYNTNPLLRTYTIGLNVGF
jgi:TonB-linked SusC/RagA family outer membrane protein